MSHLLSAIIALFVFALLSLFVKRDPNKWYGDMLCMGCAYRWTSRKRTPPARCPRCGGRYLHTVTINRPVPERRAVVLPDLSEFEAPQLPRQKEITVKVEHPVLLERRPEERQFENHKKLEKILRYRDISLEEKAYFLVAFTRNADPTNLMHRLKVDESRAKELLQYLEQAKHVSLPDELGERLVLAPVPS